MHGDYNFSHLLQTGLELKLQDEESRRKDELCTAEYQRKELRQQLLEEVVAYKVIIVLFESYNRLSP